jgi:hypothetical protein
MTLDPRHLELDRLEALIRELQSRGQPIADDDTLRTLMQATDTLSSRDLGNYQRQDALLYEAADLALRSGRTLPLEDELNLLAHLETDQPDDGHVNAAWREKRRDRANRWLSALRRLDEAVDSAFDPNDTPALNVPAPEGLPAGVAPVHIRDPELRQRYEADIESNLAKADRYAQQWRVRQLRELYEPRAIRYLARAYGTRQAESAELVQLLDEYEVTPRRRAAILAAARTRTQGKPS